MKTVIIDSFDELLKLNIDDSAVISKDIDAEYRSISSICSLFRGKIDGKNHTIRNLVIEQEAWDDAQQIALFECLHNAEIKDIEFENIEFKISLGVYHPHIAVLCSVMEHTSISNISVEVTISGCEAIPLIEEATDSKISNVKYLCNGLKGVVIEDSY